MLSKIHILGSSSAGCAYILHFHDKLIQLDAGIKNPNSKDIDTLFISHLTHYDHDKYLKDFNKEHQEIVLPFNGVRDQIPNFNSFVVPHKVLNNGYIFTEENETIGYITDCGDYRKIDIDLSKCTYLFIECNWDYFLIKQEIIKARPHSIYAFSKEGHMSNLDCLNAIAKGKVNKDCKIILVHKSQDHSDYISTYKMFESLPNKVAIAPREEGTIWCKAGTYTGDDRGRIIK